MTSLTLNPPDALHSMAKWIVSRAEARTPAVAIEYTGTPRQLWRNVAVEDSATDPYAVMRIYPGGPRLYSARLPTLSVQIQTRGEVDDQALNLAQTLFEAFLDEDGAPLRNVAIPGFLAETDASSAGYQLIWAELLQVPGSVGRDDRGRDLVTFNVDLGLKPN